jgi:Zn ribbon nucleic-acid-binding protein
MNIVLAAKIIALKSKALIFDPLFGISCPLCGGKPSVTSTRNENIATIRFHRCLRCGWTFKSVERLEQQKKRKNRKVKPALSEAYDGKNL